MDGTVGIRDLRRSLSRFIDRVGRGERVIVTEHGRPVAILSPWLEPGDPLEQLVGQGEATRPSVDLLSIPPLDSPISTRGTDALLAERSERLA
jgi:prevent-host-death family protein